MEIIPDPLMAGWLTVPFLLAFLALRSVFSPVLAYMEGRELVQEKALTEAASLEDAALQATADLEERLRDARRAAGETRVAAKQSALSKEADILAAAREEAEAKITEAVTRIAGEKDAAARLLRGTAKTLSGEIAAQVLGRQA